MRLESLRYLIDFSTLGSVSATAAKNYMTEQGMSRVFRQLEKDLGVSLFKREGKSFKLTRAGLDIVAQSRAVVDGCDSITRTAERYSAREGQDERAFPLFVTPCASLCLLPLLDVLEPGALPFPVSVREENLGFFELMTNAFRADEGGLGIVTLPFIDSSEDFMGKITDRNLVYEGLLETEAVALVSASSPHASGTNLPRSRYTERVQGSIGVACMNDSAVIAQIEDTVRRDNIRLVTNNIEVIMRQVERGQVAFMLPRLALMALGGAYDVSCLRLPDENAAYSIVRFGLVAPAGYEDNERIVAVKRSIVQSVRAASRRADFSIYAKCLVEEGM